MNKEEKYTIALAILSILLFISIVIIGVLTVLCTDLRDTANIYKNTIGVCKIDLEEVQKENEELRGRICE